MKNCYQQLININAIDYSLRTYLRYFFLESNKVDLDIMLNETKINYVSLKDEISIKVKQESMNIINEENIYEGLFIKNNSNLNIEVKEIGILFLIININNYNVYQITP